MQLAGAERLALLRRRHLPRPCRTGKGTEGLACEHHGVHVVVVPIGKAKGRNTVGQQHHEIATCSTHIGDLEQAPVGSAIGYRPERQMVPALAEAVLLAAGQPHGRGLVQGLGQFGGVQYLLALMLATVL